MQVSNNALAASEPHRTFIGGGSNEPAAGSVKQSMDVAKVDTAGALTPLEKTAYLVAAFMMLAPLAVAAWGATFGA